MYQAGEYVVYAGSGLCLVEQVGVPDFNAGEHERTYYFLRTTTDRSRIYVPTDTQLPLRSPMTEQEAVDFLDSVGEIPVSLPARRDRKTVVQHYQSMLSSHTKEALAQAIKSIRYAHRDAAGRMSGTEENVLRRAEKQLCSELSGVLNISMEDAGKRLSQALTAQS
ncbi:MAG: hypothetical protein IJ664_04935 [Clostridia bacterium]|nr:hypothetical protein [Clostridia bacterium]